MQAFEPLFYFNLPIPVWQIVLYVGLMSFFLIAHKVRLSLITSYLFILFWLYYSFRGDLVSVTKQDFVVKNVYDLFGFVLVGLGVFAFFFLERGNDVLPETLKKRSGEIADLKFKLKKAEKRTRSLEMEVEETQSGLQSQASGLKRVLDAKIDELEDRLEDREALLEKRDGEIAAYKLKAEEAEKRAHALETQAEENQRSFHTEESTLKKKLEQELNAKIGALEGRLKDRESLLEKRLGEIENLKLKAEDADKKSRTWKTQAEETQQNFRTQEATLKKKLGEIEDLKLKGAEAEKKVQALKTHAEETQNSARALETQIEEIQRSFQTRESALKKILDAKIDELEHRLKERESLLEKRAGEIANFNLKAEEADKRAQDLKSQVAETQRSFNTRESALKNKLEEELNAKIGELEHRLKEKESLLEKRTGEIANFKLKAEEADKRAQALKMQAEETQRSFHTQESALKKNLEQNKNAKISELEHRLKERESLIEKRDSEVANFKLKAEEAEKKAHALKTQVEEAQKIAQTLMTQVAETQRSFQSQESALKKKLEEGLNAKIGALENRLKERESHLEKRAAESAAFKLKAEEAEKKAHALKTQVEKAQETAQTLMTQVAETQFSFHSQESALKKKLEEVLKAKIGELEQRLKDRESLLQKRDGEIAAFELKAEEAEKRAQALKMQAEEIQKKADGLKNQEQKDRPGSKVQDSNHKNLEQELKNKLLELKDIQAQVNHKDGLLSLMAKRNKELADLKSNAEQRIEALEAQLKDGQQVLRTEDSGNSHSNPDQNHKTRHT
jgi:chromosome segregation ATPase